MIVIIITVAAVVAIAIAVIVIVCIVYWRRKKRWMGLNPTPATEHIYDVPSLPNAPIEGTESLAMKRNLSYSPLYPRRSRNSQFAMANPALRVGRDIRMVQNGPNAPTKGTESLAMKDNLSFSPVYPRRSRNAQLPMSNPAFHVGTADLEMV